MLFSEMELYTSKSGKPTLGVNGIFFHSRFDPEAEAKRFIDSQTIRPESVVVLLFPGLEYSYNYLVNQFPSAKILVFQPSRAFFQYWSHVPALTWTPDDQLTLTEFFYTKFSEHEFGDIVVLSWDPLMKQFPTETSLVQRELVGILSSYAANIHTKSYFGKRWIWNIVGNLLAFDRVYPGYRCICETDIAASGPSLFESLVGDASRTLLSLPSSIRALYSRRMVPDIIVSSDAGYYAARHLDFIDLDKNAPLICAALRGMLRPLWGSEITPFLWKVGVPLEDELCVAALGDSSSAQRTFAQFPDRGTVAISAMDLIVRYHDQQTRIHGFDLASRDLSTHVRPHTNEYSTFVSAARNQPLFSATYAMMLDVRSENLGDSWWTHGSLKLYRDWLLTNGSRFENKVVITKHSASPQGLSTATKRIPESKSTGQTALDSESRFNSIELADPVDMLPLSDRVERFDDLFSTLIAEVSTIDLGFRPGSAKFELLQHISPFKHREYAKALKKGVGTDMTEDALRRDALEQLESLRNFIREWTWK